ncbi:MAG TPA: WYL domain-containing protein, partial [Pyrinomonadaceae bacterium]|nr:WYL domain-containing protein [Pyrinomonadaceae bacterium]
KGSAWYLVAGIENSIRSYRISRIAAAEVLDQPCEVPADFDLASFWEQSKTDFKAALPNYVARFRVAPEVFPRLRFAGRFARVNEPTATDEHGWLQVAVGFDVEEIACEYALSFGSKLEVLEPRSLREKVIAAAKDVVEFYGPQINTENTGLDGSQ